MTDQPTKPVPTDSRQPGFNPEVEESKAAAEKAAAEKAATDTADAMLTPPTPVHSHRCEMCGALYEKLLQVCAACGASGSVTSLAKPGEG